MKTDLTYLKNMSAGNKELVLEMIDIFKSQVIEFCEGMDSYLKKNEFEQLGRLAHKAKSSISIMGLHDLANSLKEFENITKLGTEQEKYPGFIEMFKAETQEAVEELDEVSKNIDIYF